MSSSVKHPGLLIVLCGPSGVGKSSISLRLSQRMNVTYIQSVTTRTERGGDEKGKKYEYVTREDFLRRLDHDQFLEYAQIYDCLYGTPKHPALDDLAAGHDVLLEIDVQGALQVRYQYPQAVLILIEPPDAGALLHRLEIRARDTKDDIQRRFRDARREVQMAKGSRAFDYTVINDDLDRAVDEIAKIVKTRRAAEE